MANTDIKKIAKQAGVKLWQIAKCLGLADTEFSKKLRQELSKEEKAKIISIIKEIKSNMSSK